METLGHSGLQVRESRPYDDDPDVWRSETRPATVSVAVTPTGFAPGWITMTSVQKPSGTPRQLVAQNATTEVTIRSQL